MQINGIERICTDHNVTQGIQRISRGILLLVLKNVLFDGIVEKAYNDPINSLWPYIAVWKTTSQMWAKTTIPTVI